MVWMIGLLVAALPVAMIFANNLIPAAGAPVDTSLLDVSRQAYPNLLFAAIAISGVAIAEAIILF